MCLNAGDDRVRVVLRGDVVVCEEAGAGVHGGFQPSRADNGRLI